MSDALELQLQMAISSPVSLPAQPVVAEPPPALSIQVWFWYFFQVLLSESLQQSFCLRVDRVLIFIYLCVCAEVAGRVFDKELNKYGIEILE